MSLATPDIILPGGNTTLLSLATTAILATYVYTPSLYCCAGEVTIFVTATKNATISTVTVAIQISNNDVNFQAVQSKREDLGTEAAEHTITLAAGANRIAIVCNDAKRAVSMRVGIKADVQGGTGEAVTLTGRAW